MSDTYYFEVDAFPDDPPHNVLYRVPVTICEVESASFDGLQTFHVIGYRDDVVAAARVLDIEESEIEVEVLRRHRTRR